VYFSLSNLLTLNCCHDSPCCPAPQNFKGGTATAVVVLYVKNRLPPGFEISDEFLTDVVHRASGCDGHFDSSDNHHKEPVKLSRD